MSRKRTCAISSSILFLTSVAIQEETKLLEVDSLLCCRRCRAKVRNGPKKWLREAQPFDSLTLAQDRVEWLRFFSFTKSPAISASFLARDHFLIWISRFRAEPSVV